MTGSHEDVAAALANLSGYRLFGYPGRPLPDPLDEEIDALLDRYLEGDEELRSRFRAAIGLPQAAALEAYGVRMASVALRDRSPDALLRGLVAAMLAGSSPEEDPREVLLRVPPLHRSAERLGVNPASLFATAAELAGPDTPVAVRAFPERAPADRSLEAFYWEERDAADDGLFYAHRI